MCTMTRQRSWPSIALVIIVVLHVGVCSVDDNRPVTILRCCAEGASLDPSAGNAECYPMNTSTWPPYIYSPRTQEFRDTPRNWKVVVSKPKCSYSSVISDPKLAPSFLMFDNGSLWVQDVKSLLPPQRYCVEERVALVCLEGNEQDSGPRTKATVKKCCGPGGVYSEAKASCIVLANATGGSRVWEWASLGSNLTDNTTVFTTGFPSCPSVKSGQHLSYVIVGGFDGKDVTIDSNGVLRNNKADVTIEPSAYCLEHVFEHSTIRANIFTCPPVTNKTTSLIRNTSDFRFTLYPIGLVLSVFFLAATIAVGFVLPSSHQHMLHWRCQTGHVGCLLIGDLLLAATQFAGDRIPGPLCQVVAIAMHFFFLAAFFWLNTMCFNIWWTFRDMRPASLDKGQETFRLRLYQVYAWGGSLLIAGVAAIIDTWAEDAGYALLRPRFGHQRCWFADGDAEIFTYFYGPMGVLMTVNLVLFVMTARELTCGLWKREVAKTNAQRTALSRVCLKLVIVMGLTWVVDVVSWVVGGPNYLWYLTDLINALQGVFIFIVVGCQPQIWAAIHRMWCFNVNQQAENNVANNMSSCSQGMPSIGDSVTANSPQMKSIPSETIC